MRLPRATAAEVGVTAPEAASSPARRRVLVIEDHDDNREILTELLRLSGHDVYSAGDGRSGVRIAHERRPDIAFVDIGLPDIDGYEVGRRLRDALGSGIRLVALTGFGQPQDRERALTAGFDARLVKPVTPESLEAAVVSAPVGS